MKSEATRLSSDFFIQATNLLAQQLAAIKGEEIYTETACMDAEYRQTLAALSWIEGQAPGVSDAIKKIKPFIILTGKALWVRSELTDLGLRVGQRNLEDIKDDEKIDDERPGE